MYVSSLFLVDTRNNKNKNATLTEEPCRAIEVPHDPWPPLKVCQVALHQPQGLGVSTEGNAGLPGIGGEGWVGPISQQEAGQLPVAILDGLVQRPHPLVSWRIDVGTMGTQDLGGAGVC